MGVSDRVFSRLGRAWNGAIRFEKKGCHSANRVDNSR